MSIDNGLKIGSSFEGHSLALAVLGLLRYGKLPNWDERATLDNIHTALVQTGDGYLIGALNQSHAFRLGISALSEMDPDEGKEKFQSIATAVVGSLLQEWGGLLGIEASRERAIDELKNTAMTALHGKDLKGNPAGLDSFTTRAFTGSDEAIRAAIAKEAGVDPSHVVKIDADTDIDAQLEGVEVPEEVKASLRAIGEKVKQEQAKAASQGDMAAAEALRKQGKLN